jgi:hypothetical protein
MPQVRHLLLFMVLRGVHVGEAGLAANVFSNQLYRVGRRGVSAMRHRMR